MIAPEPEMPLVITNPEDIPQVETLGFYVSVRATYLGRIWELRMDNKSKDATLSIVSREDESVSEVINTIRYIDDGMPLVDIVGLAGMATHLQNLIYRYSHKTFVLEGKAKNAI